MSQTSGACSRNRVGAYVAASTAHTAGLVRGAVDPPQGWVSRRYGEMQPAPVLETRMSSRAPALFATVLAPTSDSLSWRLKARAQSRPVHVLEQGTGRGRAIALAIPRPRGEDLVVLASRGVTVETGSCRARAEVVWVRLEDDRPVRLLALDAAYVEVARRRYLEQDQPAGHFFWSARESPGTSTLVEERRHVRYRGDR